MGENSPVYIVRKKPFEFLTGALKSKGKKPQIPNPYLPVQQNNAQATDIVVTVNGSDETIPGIMPCMEAVEYRGSFYCTTSEGAQQAVANLMQMAKSVLDEKPYYESVLSEGEKTMEQLNPQYAEGKRQARTIEELQRRQDDQGRKLDKILSRLDEFFTPSK